MSRGSDEALKTTADDCLIIHIVNDTERATHFTTQQYKHITASTNKAVGSKCELCLCDFYCIVTIFCSKNNGYTTDPGTDKRHQALLDALRLLSAAYRCIATYFNPTYFIY